MNKWYLNSGLCLKGETADKYLNYKLNNFKKISMKIDNILKECDALNIVENDECINISVIETGENK